MCTRGCRGKPGEESNDAGSQHLLNISMQGQDENSTHTIPNLRPYLSDRYPKVSMPTTVPAKAREDSVVLYDVGICVP
jgi:hypothetical protein